MFNIMLLMVSDDILSFKLISDSFNDFPYFSSSKHFPNSSDISELTLWHVTSKASFKFLPDSRVSVNISKKYSDSCSNLRFFLFNFLVMFM